MNDPKNWQKFIDVVEEHGMGPIEFRMPTPNVVMKWPGTGLKATFRRASFVNTPDNLKIDEVPEQPEDLPLECDGIVVKPPYDSNHDEFEVHFDHREAE